MSKPYLFLMLGVPGSGKSYFAENLARELGAVHLNSDAMRLAIFKSREETNRIYRSENRSILNTYTFGALNYAAWSALRSGDSVIYDANNNTRQERLDTVAAMQGEKVTPVVVWVETPHEIAVQRAQERRESREQRKLSSDDAEIYITKIAAEIQMPDETENMIKIDGTIPFEEQYGSFKSKLKEFTDE